MSLLRLPLGVLREADFRRLVIGTAVSRFGNGLATVALAFAVLDLTGSIGLLGAVVAARSIANVSLVLLGGVLADRLPRGLLLTGSAVLSGVVQLAFAGLVALRADLLWLLVLLAALNGAASAVSQPLATALVPQTLPEDRLQDGNALSRLSSSTTNLLGVAAAGVVVSLAGSAAAVAADGVTFLVAAAAWSRLRVAPPPRESATSFLADLADGWQAFRSRRWLWSIVGAFTVSNCLYAGSLDVLGPAWADATFGRAAWGLVNAALPAGLVVGGLIAFRIRTARPLAVAVVGALPFSAIPLLVGAVPLPVVLVLFLLLAGIGAEIFEVLWQTEMQRRVPAGMLARVSSYDLLGSFVAIPLGQLIAAPLGAALGLRPALVWAGAIATAVLASCLLVRDVRARSVAAPSPPAG